MPIDPDNRAIFLEPCPSLHRDPLCCGRKFPHELPIAVYVSLAKPADYQVSEPTVRFSYSWYALLQYAVVLRMVCACSGAHVL